jgi:TatD family hydrolase
VLNAGEEEWENLVRVVKEDPLVRAIGEIGLDNHYEEGYSPSALQGPWFRRQLQLAKELDKPVVIHSRDAWDETFAMLEEEGFRGRPLLWHCFGGDIERASQIVERGWHVAVGGASTFKANGFVREAVKAIPLDRLHLETDCPYLAPMPWRGKTCEPALTVFTADCLARELGINPNTVAKAYQELESEGVIYSMGGRGSFISGDLLAAEGVKKEAAANLAAAAEKARRVGLTREEAVELIASVFEQGGEKP